MRLGIITDCIHYHTAVGGVATENHILLRQLQALSRHFAETTICCPFEPLDNQKVVTPYTLPSIKFIPLPNVGGNTIGHKLKLISTLGKWWAAFKKVDVASDIVYQRFPNNLNIPGFFYFFLKKKKTFATYTGTWAGYPTEPVTYRLQRWLLQHWFRGPVWVYISKQEEKGRIKSGFSPSYSLAEWQEETEQVQQRIQNLALHPLQHLRLITVGTLIGYKNQLTILKACTLLQQKGVAFNLTIVGDGPMRNQLEQFINEHQLQNHVQLCGKKNYSELRQLYRQHDFVVQAPLSEGFGKVPIEGFFHGVIPVINNIAMAAHMTGNNERGFLFNAADATNVASVLASLQQHQLQLPAMITKGRAYAQSQTLEAWANDYYTTVTNYFEQRSTI